MAKWRAVALELLPELQKIITKADNVMALWIDLFYAFEKAYESEPPDESLIGRIYSYADWCMQAPRGPDAGHDPSSAVIIAFYEDIPKFRPAGDDMPRWFRYDEVAKNREIFSYMIGAEEYDALVSYMAKNRHRYKPRARPKSS